MFRLLNVSQLPFQRGKINLKTKQDFHPKHIFSYVTQKKKKKKYNFKFIIHSFLHNIHYLSYHKNHVQHPIKREVHEKKIGIRIA